LREFVFRIRIGRAGFGQQEDHGSGNVAFGDNRRGEARVVFLLTVGDGDFRAVLLILVDLAALHDFFQFFADTSFQQLALRQPVYRDYRVAVADAHHRPGSFAQCLA
jgi:hypothetical protein